MVLVVSMTPVMYSDPSGYAPEKANIFELITGVILAVGAIVVGVLAIATSIISLPLLISSLLICIGVSILSDYVTIAKALYNYSQAMGRFSSETLDDVIDATGKLAIDRVVYHTAYKMMIQMGIEGIYSSLNVISLTRTIESTVTITRRINVVPYIAVFLTGSRIYQTIKAIVDDVYCFDKAERCGWKPWVD